MRLDESVKKAGSVIGVKVDCMGEVVERYTMRTVESILNNTDHPFYNTLTDPRSSGGGRLLSLRCRMER